LQQGLPKPLAHWRFDEGSGDTIADASNNGSTGTRQGASWVDGYYGRRALSFDGQDDRVVIQPAPSLNILQDTFTLAFWANPQATHEVDQESNTGTSGVTGQRYAFGPLFRGGTADGMVAGVGVSVGTNGISVYEHSDGYLPARLVYEAPVDGWRHITVVYQDRRPRLYVNGRLVRELSDQSPKAHVCACPNGIGGMGYGFYYGQLDDVRIYAQALAADQIDLLAFTLTDRRTDGELSTLRALCQRLLKPYENPPSARPPSLKESTPAFLKELFFFVPLQLAMQL
jgi:hypothetical protein